MKRLFVVLLAVLAVGCSSELHHNLSESQANEVVVSLEQAGIEADKSRDEINKGRWVVSVPEGVRVHAWQTLQAQGLPRPEVNGFGSFFPREGLVPTAEEERVVMQFATAQELRQTLLAVDGVVDAHVNLVVPPRARLGLRGSAEPPKPRASVLIKSRRRNDDTSPIAPTDIQRLVAGAVESLAADDVIVVISPVDTIGPAPELRVSSVGPVSVAEGNKLTLQLFVALLMLVILAQAGALGFIIVKFRSKTA